MSLSDDYAAGRITFQEYREEQQRRAAERATRAPSQKKLQRQAEAEKKEAERKERQHNEAQLAAISTSTPGNMVRLARHLRQTEEEFEAQKQAERESNCQAADWHDTSDAILRDLETAYRRRPAR